MEVPRAFDLGRDRRVPILKVQLFKETFIETKLAYCPMRLTCSLFIGLTLRPLLPECNRQWVGASQSSWR